MLLVIIRVHQEANDESQSFLVSEKLF